MLKKLTPEQVRAYSRRADSQLSSASDQVVRDLKKLYRDFILRFSDKLRKNSNVSDKDIFDRREAVKVMNQLTTILDEAGLGDVVNGYRDKFSDITLNSLRYFEMMGVKPSLRSIDANALDALIQFSETGLRDMVQAQFVAPLRSALIQSSVGNLPRADIVDTILAIGGDAFSPGQAAVLVNETFNRYSREVRARKAQELDLVIYQYQGPDDKITRPACHYMLNYDENGAEGYFYQDEITADLHPDLEENPMLVGGGWNCRHAFFPVTLDFAKSQGFEPRAEDEDQAA